MCGIAAAGTQEPTKVFVSQNKRSLWFHLCLFILYFFTVDINIFLDIFGWVWNVIHFQVYCSLAGPINWTEGSLGMFIHCFHRPEAGTERPHQSEASIQDTWSPSTNQRPGSRNSRTNLCVAPQSRSGYFVANFAKKALILLWRNLKSYIRC